MHTPHTRTPTEMPTCEPHHLAGPRVLAPTTYWTPALRECSLGFAIEYVFPVITDTPDTSGRDLTDLKAQEFPLVSDEWPPFLGLVTNDGGDNEDAGTQLSTFLYRLFTIRPPRSLSSWIKAGCGEHIEDFIQDLYIHLHDNAFARLRTYKRIEGRPFAAWVLRVANNLMSDCIKGIPPGLVIDGDPEGAIGVDPPPGPVPPGLARAVQMCLEELSKYRQVLVKLRYQDGFKPREIENLLKMKAKTISDDACDALDLLRACVKKKYPGGGDAFREWLGG